MTKLTRSEIRMIMTLVASNRDNSDACRQNPNNIYRSLHEREYENMNHIYETLQAILDSDAKRITIQ